MLEVTAKVNIKSSPETIWKYMINLNNWLVDSNPEHIRMEFLSDSEELKRESKISIIEKVACIRGEATGEIIDFVLEKQVTWKSNNAVYHYSGLNISVQEGVTWSLRITTEGTELSAHVWASFPGSLFGKIIEWYFKNVLKGVQKDYDHTLKELLFIKKAIEN